MQKINLGYAPSRGQVAIFRGGKLSGETAVVTGGKTFQISTKSMRFSDVPDGDFARTRLGNRTAVAQSLRKIFVGFDENEVVTVVEFL